MSLFQRYKKLTFWNKFAFWGSLASIIGLLLFVFTKKAEKGDVTVTNSPNTTVQNMVDSPNSTQIYAENVHLNSPSEPQKLSEKSKNLLLNAITQFPEKEILIKINLGDEKILPYANSIKEFIKSKTGKIAKIERGAYGNPIVGQDMIHLDREKIEITVSSK